MKKRGKSAFTLIELLTVISIIAILASMLLVAMSNAQARSRQTACLNNLHQLGLGFTGFSLDHEGKYPMDLPERLGGSFEFNESGVITNTPFSRDFHHFAALSNDVPNVKVMVCPADRRRRPAQDYRSFTGANLSFWANPKATPHATASFLAGDWNLIARAPDPNDLQQIAFGREVHRHKGSVLFADGRVEITRTFAIQSTPKPDPVEIAIITKASPTAAPDSPALRPQNPPTVTRTPVGGPPSVPNSNPSAPASVDQPTPAKPLAVGPPSTNRPPQTVASVPQETESLNLRRISAPADASSGRSSEPEVAPNASSPPGFEPTTRRPEDSEPWDTPGFRLFKALAIVSYLLSLLLALLALLLLYLRARLAQRAEQRAPGIKMD